MFVGSSSIKSATYDVPTQVLSITFKGGATYDYADVPHIVYTELILAQSTGKFVSANIVPKYKSEKHKEDSTRSAASEVPFLEDDFTEIIEWTPGEEEEFLLTLQARDLNDDSNI